MDNKKLQRMVKNIIVLLIFINLIFPALALENQGFYDLADSALKGGTKFTNEQIQDISQQTNIPIHHRIITQITMLGSVEEESRYLTAISKATDYVNNGDIEWAKDYLQMQRGFLYGLLGDRDKGMKDLVAVLNADRLASINSIEDPILDVMRKRTRDLSLDFDSLMKQTIGNYYMDFRKEGALPVEAFRYFNLIKSIAFRDKCLLQLKDRVGTAEYEKISQSVKVNNSILDSKNTFDARESENVSIKRKQDLKSQESHNLLREKKTKITEIKPELNNRFWYLGIGLILGISIMLILSFVRLSR